VVTGEKENKQSEIVLKDEIIGQHDEKMSKQCEEVKSDLVVELSTKNEVAEKTAEGNEKVALSDEIKQVAEKTVSNEVNVI